MTDITILTPGHVDFLTTESGLKKLPRDSSASFWIGCHRLIALHEVIGLQPHLHGQAFDTKTLSRSIAL